MTIHKSVLFIILFSIFAPNGADLRSIESEFAEDNITAINSCQDAHSDNLAVLKAFLTESEFSNDRYTLGLSTATVDDIVVLSDPVYTSQCDTLNQKHEKAINAVSTLGHNLYKHTYYKVLDRYIVIRTGKKPPIENEYNLSLNAVAIYNTNLTFVKGFAF